MLYSTADTFYVNGGTFNLYSDDGKTLVKQGENIGACVASRGGGFINIRGGTFNGGQYLYFRQNNMSSWANCNKSVMPSGNTATIKIETTKGASVRTAANDPGLRFQGTISQAAIDLWKVQNSWTDSSKIHGGILIVPEDYLTATGGEFTVAALSSKSKTWATKNSSALSTAKDSYTISLALLVNEKNYSKKFVAITYIYYDNNGNGKIDNGESTVYSPEYSYARSVKETAQAALADVMLSSGKYYGRNYNNDTTIYCMRTDSGGYVNMTSGTRYSAFSDAQITVLRKYAGF